MPDTAAESDPLLNSRMQGMPPAMTTTTVEEKQTCDGPMTVKTVSSATPEGGDQAVRTFLALGGLGRSPSWRDWENSGIAEYLATRPKPWAVTLPDPYSNSVTAPGCGEFAVVLSVTTLFGCCPGPLRERCAKQPTRYSAHDSSLCVQVPAGLAS